MMRRKDKKIENQAIINEILEKSQICRLAFFDEEYPYVVPMNYGYQDNTLFFHCATHGKKIDLIKKNNKVAFEITSFHEIIKKEVSCDWSTKYRSIMGIGEIEIITEAEEKKKGLDIIMKQHGRAMNSYDDKSVKRVLVLKLPIQDLSAKQSGDWGKD
jgi:nitroimidazol reductase NimA-like FMN-containing flavoprotein (pyridoxamine 5'-phosphate oxidase superfamily)